ncbi:fatty acid desaturase 4, chloroplastic [Dorcoceras hygrometricum]|uniref:Fatty acid desaturase 4, chloroplastic n=1 Tax=Dorcoceras hygrometricum TaxID=472368 RepID=A0A2Z7A4W2_9LAMI|nr:fatty acid desaturase 4, chloroplastic [Dorcoceras hygrometricum]
MTTVMISLAKFISIFLSGSTDQWSRIQSIFAAVAGYVLSDFLSGMVHWAIDNYGDPNHPVLGPHIEGILRHHRQPWVLAHRHFATNIYVQGAAATILFTPVNVFSDDLNLLAFTSVFGCCGFLSQQFHAWAHRPRQKLPPLVAALQDWGIILAPSHHAGHHQSPFDKKYCIVNGICDWILDKSRFFSGIEVVLFHMLGVRPVSWGEPNSTICVHDGEPLVSIFMDTKTIRQSS